MRTGSLLIRGAVTIGGACTIENCPVAACIHGTNDREDDVGDSAGGSGAVGECKGRVRRVAGLRERPLMSARIISDPICDLAPNQRLPKSIAKHGRYLYTIHRSS